MRSPRRRHSWEALLISALCVAAGSLVAAAAAADGLPDLPTMNGAPERLPDLPTPAAPSDQSGAPAEPDAVDDQLDSRSAGGANKNQPDVSAPTAAEDNADASDASAVVKDRPQASATTAWFACATGEAAHLDDGRSDAATIADALATSCQTQWDASKAEQCKASDLEPAACAILSDKLDANRRSYDIKVVLALRARKAQAASPSAPSP